jgi:ATP-dependent RNA helicase DDX19/DBP5
VRNKHPLSEL